MSTKTTNNTAADDSIGDVHERSVTHVMMDDQGDPMMPESRRVLAAQEERDRRLEEEKERQRRRLDPAWLAGKEAELVREIQEIESAVMFHLADLLMLANYSCIHTIDKVTRRAIHLLKPLAPHSRQVRNIYLRLCEVHGRTEFIPEDHTIEDSHDVAPDVVLGRLKERQQFLKTSTLWDLRHTKKWAAEARAAQRQVKDSAENSATAA